MGVAPGEPVVEVMSRRPLIIGLTGLAGSGKSAAAYELFRLGYTRHRFSGPLKAMMVALGLGFEEIEGDLKEVPCAFLGGATPRHAMQTLGTEWGRRCMPADFWVGLWREAAREAAREALRSGEHGVVAEDCRFPNEARAVRDLGGQIWRVTRPGLDAAGGHLSEQIQAEIKPDWILNNDGTLDALGDAVRARIIEGGNQ